MREFEGRTSTHKGPRNEWEPRSGKSKTKSRRKEGERHSITPTDNSPAGLMNWDAPTGITYANMPRSGSAAGNAAVLSTGRLTLAAIYLPSTVVSTISFVSGTTALSSPSNWWFALYNSSYVLLGQTADQTSAAWTAQTLKTLSLTSAYNVTAAGLYYLGIMVKATTVPTLAMVGGYNVLNDLAPFMSQDADTGLTTTAPNPATPDGNANTNVPYCGVA